MPSNFVIFMAMSANGSRTCGIRITTARRATAPPGCRATIPRGIVVRGGAWDYLSAPARKLLARWASTPVAAATTLAFCIASFHLGRFLVMELLAFFKTLWGSYGSIGDDSIAHDRTCQWISRGLEGQMPTRTAKERQAFRASNSGRRGAGFHRGNLHRWQLRSQPRRDTGRTSEILSTAGGRCARVPPPHHHSDRRLRCVECGQE